MAEEGYFEEKKDSYFAWRGLELKQKKEPVNDDR